MSDVVEQGGADGRRRLSPRWRRALAAGLAIAAAALLWRSGLLSGGSTPAERPDAVAPANATSPRLVVVDGGRLVRYDGRGGVRAGGLPPGLARDAPLLTVDDTGQPVVMVVVGGRLFRADPQSAAPAVDVGPAAAVVDRSPDGTDVFVRLGPEGGGRLVTVDARSGIVVDRDPFPGFDGTGGWKPRGVVAIYGATGMLLSRPTADGEDLVVAWSRQDIAAGAVPQRLPIGAQGRLLGVAPARLLGVSSDWVLVLAGRCPGPGCRLEIVTVVSVDSVRSREVEPPRGWRFAPGPVGGRSHDALVPVVSERGDVTALARLVPGGASALLVRGSEGVVLGAGVVDESDGSVYFAVDAGGRRQALGWHPGQPGDEVVPVGAGTALPATARLVCVCG